MKPSTREKLDCKLETHCRLNAWIIKRGVINELAIFLVNINCRKLKILA